MEAAEHYQEMLRLNPNDDQGVRHALALLLLVLDRDEDFQRLLTQFQDHTSEEWADSEAAAGRAAAARRSVGMPLRMDGNSPFFKRCPYHVQEGPQR